MGQKSKSRAYHKRALLVQQCRDLGFGPRYARMNLRTGSGRLKPTTISRLRRLICSVKARPEA